ncbi:MAG: hypothetical protein AUF65_01270 [Chloroflexi bacterium 13_1_20CM_50_12]|nr:MAG: hypothetical protein AUF65_01270 [Chloroflexi bacterium 13_1_20CM_50_12]
MLTRLERFKLIFVPQLIAAGLVLATFKRWQDHDWLWTVVGIILVLVFSAISIATWHLAEEQKRERMRERMRAEAPH